MLKSIVGLSVFLATLVASGVSSAGTPPGPDATTGNATEVTKASMTLHGTILPRELPTTVHFEYGALGRLQRRTPPVVVEPSSEPVPVSASIADLRPATMYSYRVVAESSGGSEVGATLQQATSPDGRPSIGGAATGWFTATAMTATANVHVHDGPTTVTATYGGPGTAASGTAGPITLQADGPVSFTFTGLTPSTRYTVVFTAQNVAGIVTVRTYGRTRNPVPVPRLRLSADVIPYGGVATITGRLPGAMAGVDVTLQSRPFPFSAPFAPSAGTAVAQTDERGHFSFRASASITTRYGVTANGFTSPSSLNWATLRVSPRITLSARRLRHGRYRISGSYVPDVAARVWLVHDDQVTPVVTVARRHGAGRSFRFPIRRLLPGVYQVWVAVPPRPSIGLVGARSPQSFRVRPRHRRA